jgi:hypothetical protein
MPHELGAGARRTPELANGSHQLEDFGPRCQKARADKWHECNGFSAVRWAGTCRGTVQAREAERMSHRGVEVVLGRLATDEAWRERFRRAPALALRDLLGSGLELSAVELAALEALDPSAVVHFAHALDPRLQKAVLVAPAEGDASQD